jgi:hypothetical protein
MDKHNIEVLYWHRCSVPSEGVRHASRKNMTLTRILVSIDEFFQLVFNSDFHTYMKCRGDPRGRPEEACMKCRGDPRGRPVLVARYNPIAVLKKYRSF